MDVSPQIFLGGSCNPTTWRRDIAIPYLEYKRIRYYNPQVDDWRPELVQIEAAAKDIAQVLLFHIDNQTLGTSSLVEIAYLLGRRRKLVVSMEDIAGARHAEVAAARRYVCELHKHACNSRLFVDTPDAPFAYGLSALQVALIYAADTHSVMDADSCEKFAEGHAAAANEHLLDTIRACSNRIRALPNEPGILLLCRIAYAAGQLHHRGVYNLGISSFENVSETQTRNNAATRKDWNRARAYVNDVINTRGRVS